MTYSLVSDRKGTWSVTRTEAGRTKYVRRMMSLEDAERLLHEMVFKKKKEEAA